MIGMKLAIIGARGIGNHGGFETVVGELAPRLQAKGHDVYCSVRRTDECSAVSEFRGVKLICFPFSFPESYSLGKMWEVFYDSYFVLKCRLFMKCDVVYCLGVASGFSLLLTRWSRSISVVNVDGLEWTRGKFGILARFFLRASFIASCIGSDRIVLDNRRLEEFTPKEFRRKAVYIPYGVSTIGSHKPSLKDCVTATGSPLDVAEGGYWLIVARLEPENNIHTIIEAYLRSESHLPLVIVGDCSSRRYEKMLLSLAKDVGHNKRIAMVGSIYDQELLTTLRLGCAAYIHGHSVGGTNPSLLEAMSVGNTIISHDNVFNREVCSDAAVYYKDVPTLVNLMNEIDSDSSDFSELGRKARNRAGKLYRWEDVVMMHEQMFLGEMSD